MLKGDATNSVFKNIIRNVSVSSVPSSVHSWVLLFSDSWRITVELNFVSRIRARNLMHACRPRFCFVQMPLVTRHKVILWRKVKNERGVEWIKALHHISQLFTKTLHNARIIWTRRFLCSGFCCGEKLALYTIGALRNPWRQSLYKGYTIGVHKI